MSRFPKQDTMMPQNKPDARFSGPADLNPEILERNHATLSKDSFGFVVMLFGGRRLRVAR